METKFVKVSITQEMIDTDQHHYHDCPMAQALKAAGYEIEVRPLGLFQFGNLLPYAQLQSQALKWIFNYDRKCLAIDSRNLKPSKPVTFTLPVPA